VAATLFPFSASYTGAKYALHVSTRRHWFEFLTAVKMPMLFWVVILCGLVGRYQHLEEHNAFSPEDGSSMFHWNIGIYLQVHMLLQPKDQHQEDKMKFYWITRVKRLC
jgi:hypothetical protein